MKIFSGIKLLALVLFIFFIASPVCSYAIEYGGIGGKPANPRPDNPRTESIFIHTVIPGQTIRDGVLVINNSDVKKTLLVYAADSTPSTDGGFACKQFLEEKTGVGSWINLEQEEVVLDPVSTREIPFTIHVPENPDVGEHDGCILIQEKKDAQGKPGINIAMRTGIRVALTVPGELIKKLFLENFEVINKENGNYTLRPTVRNEGNVSVDAKVTVITKDIFGRVAVEHGGTYTILRGDMSRWNFELKRPEWGGRFTSQAFVEYNDGSTDTKQESKIVTFYVFPSWKAILFISLAILPILLLLLFLKIRMIRSKRRAASWVHYSVKEGEDLNILSKENSVSWKTIVNVNKLKPPYVLHTGQIIKLPPKK